MVITEEVGEGEVEEEAKIKLYVEGSEFLPNQLGVVHVYDVLASPDQEQHLHVEDNEDHDVGERRHDEEQISTLRTHYALNMRHSLRKVLYIAQRNC